MQDLLNILSDSGTLSRDRAASAMDLLLRGSAGPEQIAGFLMGLRSRGETVEELIGLTEGMRSHALQVATFDDSTMDIVGTGGDMHGTFNISTATAFVCAGAGVPIAKHGNRSVSSKCGSSQVLEQLGVRTTLGRRGVEYCLREAEIAFLFAPTFHPALRHVMPVRRALGVRTCFNILGPLCNPAPVKRHLVGAFDKDVARTMADILLALGSTHIITLHAEDGLDEGSIGGTTTLFTHFEGEKGISTRTVTPEEFGLERAPLTAILGGDAAENASIVLDVLGGKEGPCLDIVILNAALGLWAAGRVDDFMEGARMARGSIDSGAAKDRLHALVAVSNDAPKD